MVGLGNVGFYLALGAVAAHGASLPTAFGVGSGTVSYPEPAWMEGSLGYTVDGVPIVARASAFGASPDWKQQILNFREAEIRREDDFGGRKVTWRKEGAFGWAEQEALLGPAGLDLVWRLHLTDFSGNLEINVCFPDSTLGVSPYHAVFRDGGTQSDQLWVEQRAALRDLRSLAIETPQRRILIDAGDQSGWQFQDVRRSENTRGLYRMVLPLYGIGGRHSGEYRLRIRVGTATPEFRPLELGAAANMGLRDELEGDGHGGWTDQGDNDLRELPTGVQYLRGIPFRISEDPERAVLMLKGAERQYFAAEATVAVGGRVGALYFLHGCAWAGAGKRAFTATVRYEDGGAAETPVRVGQEALDWWGVRDLGEEAKVAWRGANARSPIGLMALRWVNPEPERAVRDLLLRSGDGPVAGIVAITVASAPVPFSGATAGAARLPQLKVAAAGQIGLDLCFRETRLDPDWRSADLKTSDDPGSCDLLLVCEDLAPETAGQVVDRVREGGRLLAFGPPPAGLAHILPVTFADPPVLRSIAPYWRWAEGEDKAFFLHPADPAGPLTSGFDLQQMPPAGALYELRPREEATVEAEWVGTDGERYPAVAWSAVGSGKVTYFNLPRLYPACGGTDHGRLFRSVNRYWDPLLLRLAYHAAGQDDVAVAIGRLFAAKADRERLLAPWARLQVGLEDLGALAAYAGSDEASARLAHVEDLAAAAEATIEAGDAAIEGLLGEQALPAYAEALGQLEAALAQCESATETLRGQLLGAGMLAFTPAAGSPVRVGTTHLHHGLVYPGGPSRKWLYDRALQAMRRELGWDTFDIVVGGYSANQLRPDGKTLSPGALDDIIASARDSGMDMILCTVAGVFAAEGELTPYSEADNARRAEVLATLARYLGPEPGCYGFEPNNEPGMGAKPDAMFGYDPETIGRFRGWLLERHGDLDKVSAAVGEAFATAEEITPPRPEDMEQVGPGRVRRALWAEWIEFRFELMERMHRSDYEALRAESDKPIFDRTAGDGMNWCGVPGSGALHAARQDRRSLWHDALGSHVISPFLLDYQVGMSRGRRIGQSEYYWSTYGGASDGVRYRFGGNFMHPYQDNDARNFAAVGRNFWKALSRGNDLFTLYFANPANVYAQYDEGYWGAHCAYLGDGSFKAMTHAMSVYPAEANRLRGELVGATHVPQVGILEPLASIVHTTGTAVGQDVRDVQYEAEGLHRTLLAAHVQTEVVGEWRLLEGPPAEPEPGSSVSAMPRELPPVLIVPYGVFLSNATQDRLIDWVRGGGVLLATGPIGLYDELGRDSGRLLQAAFPGVTPARGDGAATSVENSSPVRRRWSFAAGEAWPGYADGRAAVLRGPIGAGELIVTGFAFLDGAQTVGELVGALVGSYAPPRVTADNERVQVYLCRRGATDVLYVINEDHAYGQQVEVSLATPALVSDLRLGLTLGSRDRLTLSLRPGECRVFRLEGSE